MPEHLGSDKLVWFGCFRKRGHPARVGLARPAKVPSRSVCVARSPAGFSSPGRAASDARPLRSKGPTSTGFDPVGGRYSSQAWRTRRNWDQGQQGMNKKPFLSAARGIRGLSAALLPHALAFDRRILDVSGRRGSLGCLLRIGSLVRGIILGGWGNEADLPLRPVQAPSIAI